MQDIIDTIVEFFLWAIQKSIAFLKLSYEWFIRLDWPEKTIFLNGFLAVVAVVTPAARFYIFENWHYINNPLSVYLVGIAILMFVSIFVNNLWISILRVVFNLYYLAWVIYLPLANELTKANPHEISNLYYINIAVPLIYIIFSVMSYLFYVQYER